MKVILNVFLQKIMGYKADKFRNAVLSGISIEVKGKVSGSQSFFDSALSDVSRKFENKSLSAEESLVEVLTMLKKFSVYLSGSDERSLKHSLESLIRSL